MDSWVNFAVGRGYDLEGEDEKAKELCEELGEKHNLDEFIPNIARNVAIAGYCPVETFITSIVDKCALRIVHPKTVKDLEWNEDKTEVVNLIQQVGMKTQKLKFNTLSWFNYGQVGNNPFGTSSVGRVLTYLDYKEKAVTDMDAILENYASPLDIWKSKGNIKPVKEAVTTRKAGEGIFLGNLGDIEMEHVVEIVQMDPRAKFWEYIEYIDQLIYVGLMAPSLFYFRDATEASARVLLEIVDRNVYALARGIKRVIEEQWFKPLCELNGYEEVPKIKWRQKPPMKDLHLPDLVSQGIQQRYISIEEFKEILQNMGITFEVAPEGLPPTQTYPPPQQFPPQQPPLPFTHGIREGNETFLVTKMSGGFRLKELLNLSYKECLVEAKAQNIENPEEFCKFLAQKSLLEKSREPNRDVTQIHELVSSSMRKLDETTTTIMNGLSNITGEVKVLDGKFDGVSREVEKLKTVDAETRKLRDKEKKVLEHLKKKLNIKED